MVLRDALERCETGANPLETRGKRKPVTWEFDPRETGLSFLNGGGGGSRTHVRKTYIMSYYTVSPLISLADMLYSGQDSRSAVPGFRTA